MGAKIILILAVVGVMSIGYRTWTLGSDKNDYDIICLEGHEYYKASFSGKGFLGIKLDVNGKPCRCEG